MWGSRLGRLPGGELAFQKPNHAAQGKGNVFVEQLACVEIVALRNDLVANLEGGDATHMNALRRTFECQVHVPGKTDSVILDNFVRKCEWTLHNIGVPVFESRLGRLPSDGFGIRRLRP